MSLWNASNKVTNSPQSRVQRHNIKDKETSFCTCHKASLTIEATVIIPIIVVFLVHILFFFRIIQVQVVVEEALMYAGRRTAVESSVVDSEIIQFASAEAFLLYALKDERVIQQYVEGGSLGVILVGSEFDEKRIVLQANYRVNLPVAMFGIDGISLWSRNTFRKWVGDIPVNTTEEGTYVYVTPEGEVYHSTTSCQAIELKINKASLQDIDEIRGLDGQKYYECPRCAEENAEMGEVYYTNYGVLYHRILGCSYISRTVSKQPLSEVSNRRPCSYCY